jgi:hypothetical protein
MAEDSRFFTSSTGDARSYSSANFAEVLNKVLTTGYFAGSGGELAVTASSPADMNINVATGEAWIQGYYYKNTDSKTLAVTAADGSNPRIDRVVLELDLVTNRLINLKMLDGTPAASPVAPTLTQSGTTYQITLAQVYVDTGATSIASGTITDERDTVTAPVSGANQAKANSLYSGTIYKLTGTDAGYTTARTNGGLSAICSDGTYIYIIGGSVSVDNIKTVERFTPDLASASAGSWSAMTNITTARSDTRAVYYDGNIYVIGGKEDWNPIVYSTKNEIYSISGNSWSAGTNLTTARYNAAICLVGDDIYVMGGTTTGAAGSTKNEKYDVSGNSWSTLADLPSTPTATTVCTSCTDGTNIYLCYTDGTVRLYRYNVSGDSWTALTAPSAVVSFMEYYDGYLYAMSDNSTILRRYNITLDTWNNSLVADVGFKNETGSTGSAVTPTVFHNYRFFNAKASATNSVWFTTHYPLVNAMTARALCGFRTNNDTTYYSLKNVTTDLISPVNGVVGCAVGDKLALSIANKSATATATITVYG